MTKTTYLIKFINEGCSHFSWSPKLYRHCLYDMGFLQGTIQASHWHGSVINKYCITELLIIWKRGIYDRKSFLYAYGLNFIIEDGTAR